MKRNSGSFYIPHKMNIRSVCPANTFCSKSCSVFAVNFCILPPKLFRVVVTGGRETSSFTKPHRKLLGWVRGSDLEIKETRNCNSPPSPAEILPRRLRFQEHFSSVGMWWWSLMQKTNVSFVLHLPWALKLLQIFLGASAAGGPGPPHYGPLTQWERGF